MRSNCVPFLSTTTHWQTLAGYCRFLPGECEEEYGLESEAQFSNISDDDLDAFTHSFVTNNPDCGLKTYERFLRSCGLKVQRTRVHESMIKIDPVGLQRRLRRVLHRRRYNVPAPNSLWHLDGHHKLICWGIVIHAAIDGYSQFFYVLQTTIGLKQCCILFLELYRFLDYHLMSIVTMAGKTFRYQNSCSPIQKEVPIEVVAILGEACTIRG